MELIHLDYTLLRNKWQESEILFLKENWNKYSDLEIAHKLGRSVPSIQHKLSRLKIVSRNRNTTKNPEKTSWSRYFHNYKQGAKFNTREFSLDKDQFKYICSQTCVYCGNSPKLINPARYNKYTSHTKEFTDIIANGIDRVDSNIGYTLENSLPCCTVCNLMKLDMSVNEFLEKINQIHLFQQNT